jgi:hypothetical protein
MQLEATLNLAVRVVFARAPSATTTTAERPGAIPPAEAPASAEATAVAALVVAAVGVAAVGAGNRTWGRCISSREKWREEHAANEAEPR